MGTTQKNSIFGPYGPNTPFKRMVQKLNWNTTHTGN